MTISKTNESGETFTATWMADMKVWKIDKNGNTPVYISFSRSFIRKGITYMATTIEEALRVGIILIETTEDYLDNLEKNHP